jgi:hypothetical protein
VARLIIRAIERLGLEAETGGGAFNPQVDPILIGR